MINQYLIERYEYFQIRSKQVRVNFTSGYVTKKKNAEDSSEMIKNNLIKFIYFVLVRQRHVTCMLLSAVELGKIFLCYGS